MFEKSTLACDPPSHQQPWNILSGRTCPYCGANTRYCDSFIIYGRSYGMIYLCKPCDAWVGVHKDTMRRALGRLTNRELREWKKAAHAHSDPLWRLKKGSRAKAYSWLAREMHLPQERTHIGMFNVDQCRQVVELCKALLPA